MSLAPLRQTLPTNRLHLFTPSISVSLRTKKPSGRHAKSTASMESRLKRPLRRAGQRHWFVESPVGNSQPGQRVGSSRFVHNAWGADSRPVAECCDGGVVRLHQPHQRGWGYWILTSAPLMSPFTRTPHINRVPLRFGVGQSEVKADTSVPNQIPGTRFILNAYTTMGFRHPPKSGRSFKQLDSVYMCVCRTPPRGFGSKRRAARTESAEGPTVLLVFS